MSGNSHFEFYDLWKNGAIYSLEMAKGHLDELQKAEKYPKRWSL